MCYVTSSIVTTALLLPAVEHFLSDAISFLGAYHVCSNVKGSRKCTSLRMPVSSC